MSQWRGSIPGSASKSGESSNRRPNPATAYFEPPESSIILRQAYHFYWWETVSSASIFCDIQLLSSGAIRSESFKENRAYRNVSL